MRIWAGQSAAGAGQTAAGAARAPSADATPAARWLAALFGHDPTVRGSAAQLQRLEQTHRHWWRGLAAAGDERTRLTLRLEDPPDEDGPWLLRAQLQSRADPSLQVDAADAYLGTLGPLTARFPDAQALLLTGLGHARRVFPPLREALAGAAPAPVALSPEQAFGFLRDAAPLLEEGGFGVLVPPWWSRPEARLGARLRVAPAPGGGRAAGRVGLDQLLRYRWEVALGGATLSAEEFAELTRRKASLIRWRGAWVRLDPESVEAAARFFERRRHQRDLSVAEALAGAFGDRAEVAGLPVVDVRFDGEAGRWLAALEGGALAEPWTDPPGLEATLRPYQEYGAAWLTLAARLGLGVCLADDMGLGKTVQTLAFLLQERAAGRADAPSLVVCPTSVVRNWHDEATRFAPDLRVLVHHGADRARGKGLRAAVADTDLVLTSYPLLRSDAAAMAAIDWYAVVLDEAQQIKNPDTAQARAARQLRGSVRLALTGTPIENRLDELWSIVEFLNPGYLGSRSAFRTRLALPIERDGDPDKAATLRRLVRPLVLRRLKSDRDVIDDLPDKVVQRAWVHLSEEQASLYQSVVDESLRAVDDAAGIARKGLVLKMLTRLKQVCNHPAHALGERVPAGYAAGADAATLAASERRSPKLARLVALLDEALAAGDAALVFTQYRQMGDLLAAHLAARLDVEVPFLHGGVKAERRAELVRAFQAEGGPPVFLLSLKAGGTGLNLTRASHVFHYDRWWNPAVEDQATDRAYRIGQTQGRPSARLRHHRYARGTHRRDDREQTRARRRGHRRRRRGPRQPRRPRPARPGDPATGGPRVSRRRPRPRPRPDRRTDRRTDRRSDRRPRPTRAIPTDQGVATRSQRGAFVESWWAERWVAALERLITPLRLARGRTYARAGQVLSIQEDTGTVLAQVQGSRRTPYRVTIGLAPLPDAAWERVFGELSRRPDLAASLLAGEMPRDIDDVFAQAQAALFPTAPDHLRLHCNCPDKVTVCKHVAATCYLLGEQLDEDPFLLFRLRGRGREEVLEGLRRRAGAGSDGDASPRPATASPEDGQEPAPADAPTPLDPAGFWSAAEAPPRIDLPGERPDLSLLRRLGPFAALDDDLVARLGPVYRVVAAAAEAAFEAADAEPASEDDGSGTA